ncbi:MAG: hypothetical protein ACREXU_08510 [Gammaproteobacteria bacterium]
MAEILAGIAPDPETRAAALLLPALEDRRLDVTTIEKGVGARDGTPRRIGGAHRGAQGLPAARPLKHYGARGR